MSKIAKDKEILPRDIEEFPLEDVEAVLPKNVRKEIAKARDSKEKINFDDFSQKMSNILQPKVDALKSFGHVLHRSENGKNPYWGCSAEAFINFPYYKDNNGISFVVEKFCPALVGKLNKNCAKDIIGKWSYEWSDKPSSRFFLKSPSGKEVQLSDIEIMPRFNKDGKAHYDDAVITFKNPDNNELIELSADKKNFSDFEKINVYNMDTISPFELEQKSDDEEGDKKVNSLKNQGYSIGQVNVKSGSNTQSAGGSGEEINDEEIVGSRSHIDFEEHYGPGNPGESNEGDKVNSEPSKGEVSKISHWEYSGAEFFRGASSDQKDYFCFNLFTSVSDNGERELDESLAKEHLRITSDGFGIGGEYINIAGESAHKLDASDIKFGPKVSNGENKSIVVRFVHPDDKDRPGNEQRMIELSVDINQIKDACKKAGIPMPDQLNFKELK